MVPHDSLTQLSLCSLVWPLSEGLVLSLSPQFHSKFTILLINSFGHVRYFSTSFRSFVLILLVVVGVILSTYKMSLTEKLALDAIQYHLLDGFLY